MTAFDAATSIEFSSAAEEISLEGTSRKIVVIASYTPSLTNFRLELLKRMVEAGHVVHAIAPEDDPIVKADLAAIGVSFEPMPMSRTGMNPLTDLRTLTFLLRRLRRIAPDVIVPYTMKPIIYGGIAARLLGIRKRCFLVTGLGHVFSDAGAASAKRWFVRAISVALYRMAFSGADIVFAYNDADLGDIKRYQLLGIGKNAELVPGSGVDLDYFNVEPVPSGKPVFLLIARLLKDKGILDYVEAARMVKGLYPDAEFRLLGPYDPNPEAIARDDVRRWDEEGVIQYLGETRDVRPFVKDCSVFVLPTFYREGIPRSILEALAMGRAVITTDLPGCRDTVEHGTNGFRVPPRDPATLARAMMNFLVDPDLASRMGARSRELAVRTYDVHEVNRLLLRGMNLV
jgi:glycosyltransferase involved in cell wall biosynthesis